MTIADPQHSEPLQEGAADFSYSRHFPSFYVLWICGVRLGEWCWKRRRGFRNAAALLLLVMVVVYGCWEYAVGPQRDAVLAISRAGGSVIYDWQWSHGRLAQANAEPPSPRWVVNLLGWDFYGNVVAVLLPGRSVDDALMRHIARLDRLEELNVFGGKISSSGLSQVEKLTSLEKLGLPEQAFSDEDLVHLAGLTRLKWLNLSGAEITNKGLAHLAGMRQMEHLRLIKTNVTTLEPIRGLTELEELNLTGSPIDADGLKPLEGFTSLGRLWLGGTHVSDAGIAHLSTLSNLTMLDLAGTKVGDAGVRLLFDLPRITYLNLIQTQVTDAGLKELAEKIKQGPIATLSVTGPNVTMAGLVDLRKKLPGVEIIGPDGRRPRRGNIQVVPAVGSADEELPR